MATDYSKELNGWSSSDYYDDHVHKIQLPYAQVGSTNYTSTTNYTYKKITDILRML